MCEEGGEGMNEWLKSEIDEYIQKDVDKLLALIHIIYTYVCMCIYIYTYICFFIYAHINETI